MSHWGQSSGSFQAPYDRREYDRSYEARDRHWDREPPRRDWDDRGRGYDQREWERHADRDRRDDRPRDGHRDWSRGPDRDYPPRDRDFDHRHLPPSERDRPERYAEWDVPPRGGPVPRKRDYDIDDRPPPREPPTRNGSRSDEPDWKRRKVDLDEMEQPHGYGDEPYSEYQFDEQGFEINRGPPRRRTASSEPSQHVIFLGLDPDFTEADLHSYLSGMGRTLDNVTIIRDRSTGRSRSFGFAQFASVEEAREFVLPNFPFVQLPPPAAHISKGIPTAAARRVKIDFSQSAQPHPDGRRRFDAQPGAHNDGTRDIGSAPTPVVLLRLLDKSTTIEDIHKALRIAEGPGREGAIGMKRIILVVDRLARSSWGFAFVEFEEVEDASTLLAATMSPNIHPSGFYISSCIVAVSFALPYAFQLLPQDAQKEEWCVSASMAIGGAQEGWTRYWDDLASVEEQTFEVLPREKRAPAPKEKRGREKHNGPPIEIVPSALEIPAQPTELVKTAAPVSLKFKSQKVVDMPEASSSKVVTALGFSADDPSDVLMEATESSTSGVNAAPVPPAAKGPPMIANKKTADNINKWKQAQEEMSAPPPAALSPVGTTVPSIAPASGMKTRKAKAGTPSAADATAPPDLLPGDPGFEYGDPVALTCLLCLRQLKTFVQLQRHNNESDMHKTNLKNVKLCATAKEKVAGTRRTLQEKRSKETARESGSPNEQDVTSTSEPKYRDRAQERRLALNQPDIPIPQNTKADKKHVEGPAVIPPAPPAVVPAAPGQDSNNIGNKLLKKMGWEQGGGLGAEGEGRVEPIKTAIYATGAGLGAAKGKEVTNFTETSYGDAAKESARERYVG